MESFSALQYFQTRTMPSAKVTSETTQILCVFSSKHRVQRAQRDGENWWRKVFASWNTVIRFVCSVSMGSTDRLPWLRALPDNIRTSTLSDQMWCTWTGCRHKRASLDNHILMGSPPITIPGDVTYEYKCELPCWWTRPRRFSSPATLQTTEIATRRCVRFSKRVEVLGDAVCINVGDELQFQMDFY